jgi:hypothetical protein
MERETTSSIKSVFAARRRSSAFFRHPFSGLSFLLLLLVLSGCSAYHARGILGDGYSEENLGEDRWRVTFSVTALTSSDQIDTFLLYRCAELTVEKNFSYFLVVHGTEADPSLKPLQPDLIDSPSWASNAPQPPGANPPKKKRTEAVVIRVLKNKPADDQKVYDARQLIQQLTPKIHSA